MRSINYRPDIQGLRAIAVLVVLLFHFNSAWLPGGFVGVDVFLVISGFLIVSILLNRKARPDYHLGSTLRYFYTSRIKRIIPAYFAMLVLVSLLAAVLFLSQDLGIYQQGLKQAIWFNSNHYFAGFGDYFAPANHEQPLLHTWSLAVEIQFYLLAPLLVLLLPTNALKWTLVILLIGFTAIAEYRLRVLGIQHATYYSLYACLPEFFAGGLVALSIHRTTAGGAALIWQFRLASGADFRYRTTSTRAFSRLVSIVACSGGNAHVAIPRTRGDRAVTGQQTHGLAGRAVVFALPVALAGTGLAALLHRFTGTRYAI